MNISISVYMYIVDIHNIEVYPYKKIQLMLISLHLFLDKLIKMILEIRRQILKFYVCILGF